MKEKQINPKRIILSRKLIFLLIPIFGVIIMCFVQCKQDNLITIENEALGLFRNGASPLLVLDYEIESLTRMASEEEVTEPIDLAIKTPTIINQHITMELYRDGSMKMTTVMLPTSQELHIPHQTLPDYTPKPQKTVAYGEKMIFYDENNNILYTADNLPLPSSPEVANQILALGDNYTEAEINEAINTMQSSLYSNGLQDLIHNIGDYNGTVTTLSEHLISIEIPVNS